MYAMNALTTSFLRILSAMSSVSRTASLARLHLSRSSGVKDSVPTERALSTADL